ncbi:hypothetical protein ACO1O0_002672 [Amphichorda felina]
MDPQLRRRPLPPGRVASGAPIGQSWQHESLLAPDASMAWPPPPRYTRSATNLRAAHPRPSTAITDDKDQLPVDFVVDGLPTPRTLSPASTGEIRRVKSSSALSTSLDPTEASSKTQSSRWQHALGEAQYFAGGLVSRPAESTRHYSIIRHSHALVWYRGPATSVSITILSDAELPPNRTVWLQQKGYSGNMGMSLKALVGTTGDWLDVTPATKATAGDIPPVDERGIQRDLRRFAKKASGRQKKHVARETHVVRIPAAATDGYFRLVLCAGEGGKKVLCGCPVFRVASTSTDASVVRGASIRTMPLEVGVKVGSTVAQQFVKKYTAPATMVVQNRATKVVTKAASSTVVKKAATYGKKATTVGKTVVQTSGVDQAVAESWRRGQGGRYEPVALEKTVTIIGSDDGPEAPFPNSFEGKTVRATGRSTEELGIPTANLSGVRDEIKMRWKGVYAAWASVVPPKGAEDVSDDWHEAIVTIGPLRHGPPEVVVKNRVMVHFLHDFDGAAFFDMKVRVVLMGYLHPPPEKETDPEWIVEQYMADSMSVLESLARERWSIHDVLRSNRTFSDRLDGVTGSVQGRVDRIPLHWVGVRSEGGAMRDKVQLTPLTYLQ